MRAERAERGKLVEPLVRKIGQDIGKRVEILPRRGLRQLVNFILRVFGHVLLDSGARHPAPLAEYAFELARFRFHACGVLRAAAHHIRNGVLIGRKPFAAHERKQPARQRFLALARTIDVSNAALPFQIDCALLFHGVHEHKHGGRARLFAIALKALPFAFAEKKGIDADKPQFVEHGCGIKVGKEG